MMNVEGWLFQAVERFCDWLTDWQTDRWTNERTNKQTFVNVEATENVGTLTAVRGDGLVKHWTSFYWAMK